MKKGIHPQFYTEAEILDNSSGAIFNIGSTIKNQKVEISSLTHPFYTGKQRIVDTDNLVEKFARRAEKVNSSKISAKKEKEAQRRKTSVEQVTKRSTVTLKDMLSSLK